MIKKKMGKQSIKCNEVCDKFTHMISTSMNTKRHQASSHGRAVTNVVMQKYFDKFFYITHKLTL